MSKDPVTIATVPKSERIANRSRHGRPAPQPASNEPAETPELVDWEHALQAASARLIESSIEHDTLAHMEASGMAEEFAAQLCAYGLVADELDHMHKREDASENGEPFKPPIAA
jgi:hypothetical protein